ncbi:ribonuclease H-like protein [Ramaria rubella]|nr:ribonuclease H-like protein [Ramaria rubella]
MSSPPVRSLLWNKFNEESARLASEFNQHLDKLALEFKQEIAKISEANHDPSRTDTMGMASNPLNADHVAISSSTHAFESTAPEITGAQADNGSNLDLNLPLYSYKSHSPPPVRLYIRNPMQADVEVSKLTGPLGFDLEWRVIFRKGATQCKTAVLQLSDEHTILIIQLSAMKGVPPKLKTIIEAKEVIKIGVNILNDGRKLLRDFDIEPAGLLELSSLACLVDRARVPTKRMISLQRIVEMYTGHTLSKGPVRISNWEAFLNEEQLEYAANDAHSALKVYTKLMQMAQDKGLNIKPIYQGGMGINYVSDSPLGEPEPKPKPKQAISRVAAVTVTSPESQSTAAQLKSPARRQPMRAYKLWHEEQESLSEICSKLRSPEYPLARSTVITYVVEALKADDTLAFSRKQLKEFAQLDHYSWKRHRRWIETTTRGND